MKKMHTFLAVLLLALMSVGAQAQPQHDDELAIDEPAAAQERPQRRQRGARDGAPTLREVRQTARDGDVAKARTMLDQLLQRQPDNARAHLYKAQLALRDKDVATARAELQTAERLAPGLPFAREQQVTRLRTRLDRMEAREGRGGQRRADASARDDTATRPAGVPADSRTSSADPEAGNGTTTATTAGNGTPTAGNSTTPVETRTAGEDTRNMGGAAARASEAGNRNLILGAALGAVVAAVLTALYFRRRRPGQA